MTQEEVDLLKQDRIVMNANLPADRLTKREQFAMAAMQGIMASNHYSKFQVDMGIAQAAVSAADALLAELAKEKV